MTLILLAVIVTGSGILLAAYMNSLWNNNIANAYLHSQYASDDDNYGGLDYDTKNLEQNQY